jgi:hypothetical protein
LVLALQAVGTSVMRLISESHWTVSIMLQLYPKHYPTGTGLSLNNKLRTYEPSVFSTTSKNRVDEGRVGAYQ